MPSAGVRTIPRPARAEGPQSTPRSAGRRIGAWLVSSSSSPRSSCRRSSSSGTTSPPTSPCSWTPGAAGRRRPPRRSPTAAASCRPPPPRPASVAAVDLRPLAPCAPGAPCTVRLLVRLVPGAEPQVVTWSYRVVDRCTGTAADAHRAEPSPCRPQADRAAAVGVVALPALRRRWRVRRHRQPRRPRPPRRCSSARAGPTGHDRLRPAEGGTAMPSAGPAGRRRGGRGVSLRRPDAGSERRNASRRGAFDLLAVAGRAGPGRARPGEPVPHRGDGSWPPGRG